MSNWTSLSCKEDTKERLSTMKEEVAKSQDMPEQSYDLFLHSLMDTWEAAEDGYYSNDEADVTASVDVDTSEAMEKLDELDERIKDLNVVSNQQTLLKRIEELEDTIKGCHNDTEAELKTHFERELRK